MRAYKMSFKTATRIKCISVIVAAVFILSVMATVMLTSATYTATAWDVAGTVSVHVYDPEEYYDHLGAWVWLKGSSGRGYTTNEVVADEQFKKDSVNNTAHTFNAVFSESEMAKLKAGTAFGFLICVPPGKDSSEFWNEYNKETADVYIDLSQAFDASNHADVYYIRKDTVAYTDVEEAKMALEKVTSARFTGKTETSMDIAFEATSLITKDTVVELHKVGQRKSDPTEKLAEAKVIMPDDPDNPGQKLTESYSASVTFNGVAFDFSTSYMLFIKGVPTGSNISMNAFIDDIDFIKTYECEDTQKLEYGAIYSAEKTTFRVWAPFATAVTLNLYETGFGDSLMYSRDMAKRTVEGKWGGVWEYEEAGDLAGKYYTYTVDNGSQTAETIDLYAKGAGVNGQRGMVVDLKATDPDGWENDKHLYGYSEFADRADTPIIWEVHVKDFSSSPDSGMKYKGKYLAFTEEDTTVPGRPDLKTGVNYLKDLGITYVHLNPVYDFATVDESDLSVADATKDTFNWGYDPQNYNVPEGSYSTDPTRGEVRINEFKQMVMALHKAGIGVIMDVVYNHTYSTSGQAFHDTVPNYYHRTTATGIFANDSDCGNATASERTMMRKYMVDSLKYWATEYHIDGFRFDLMGIHDVRTVNMIREELDALDGGNGRKILMYGEPWSAKYDTAQSYLNRVNATTTEIEGTGKYTLNGTDNKHIRDIQSDISGNSGIGLNERVAIFGGSGRDGLRGDNNPGKGWANGNPGECYRVQKMMEGYCGGFGVGIQTKSASQAIVYASAHDNYPLWDQMIGIEGGKETPLYYEDAMDSCIKRCKLVASTYLLSTGVPFMLAGEEMGRTKYGNHNSYNSSPKVNQIVWSRQEKFSDLLATYKQLIKMRLSNHATFSYMGSTDPSNCYYSVDCDSSGKFNYTKYGKGNLNIKGTLNSDPYNMSGTVTDGTITIKF